MPESKPLGKLMSAWKCPPDSANAVDALPHLTGEWVGALLDASGACVATANKEWHPVILAAVNSHEALIEACQRMLCKLADQACVGVNEYVAETKIGKMAQAALDAAKQGASHA